MCGRYARQLEFEFTFSEREALERMNPLLVDQLMQREPAYNICPTQNQPVIALGEDGYEMRAFRWGLVPGWARDWKIGAHAINARQETVRTKPMFRSAYKNPKHRCLVPAKPVGNDTVGQDAGVQRQGKQARRRSCSCVKHRGRLTSA